MMKTLFFILMLSFLFSESLEKKFKIDGMTCGGCANKVVNAVASLDGVNSCEVNVEKGFAYISYEDNIVSEKKILETLENKTNFSCSVLEKKVKKGFFKRLFGL